MSKTVKNILLVFTVVCAIGLAVFCIELFLINRGVEAGEPDPSISGGGPGETPTDGPTDPPDSTDPAGGTGQTPENGQQNNNTDPPQPPDGKRYELLIPDGMKLVLYVSEDLFEYVDNEIDWWFTYTGGGNAKLEISPTFVPPLYTDEDHAKFLLSSYSETDTVAVGGEQDIRGSSVKGLHFFAEKNGETYELWMHNLSDSGFDSLSIVFVINHSNEAQRKALYEILDTLEMIPV